MLKLLAHTQQVGGSPCRSVRRRKRRTCGGTAVVSTGHVHRERCSAEGVLGPTRMDYPGTIASVAAVASTWARHSPSGDRPG